MPPAPGAVAMAAMVDSCMVFPSCATNDTISVYYCTTNPPKKKQPDTKKERTAPKETVRPQFFQNVRMLQYRQW